MSTQCACVRSIIGMFSSICVFAVMLFWPAALSGSSPMGGTLSPATPSVSWTGGPFTASNPLSCLDAEVTCDHFSLTITAPAQDFVVTVRISPTRLGDDFDLFARDANNNTIASSSNPSGVEELVLFNPPSGTYTIVVEPSVVVPGATYSGSAVIGSPAASSHCYHGPLFTPNFAGVPSSTPAGCSGLSAKFSVSWNPVGRDAAEPTIGITRNNSAFFAASTFDFPTATFPQRLAHTLVMRSTDKGSSWQPVSPLLTAGIADDEAVPTFPPSSLDPYVYVDTLGLSSSNKAGRVFSVDLNLVCGANAIFSDNEGASWTAVPLFGCDVPVNDHQTIIAAAPPPGMATLGYPKMLYICYNQVAAATCVRSNNGGLNFVSTAPAFTGEDTAGSGSVCGSLTGHLVADSQGRIFLPTGNCGIPRVAISADGGLSWTRVIITRNTPMSTTDFQLAVDSADNVYALWTDGTFRLPFLSVSRDHGATWSTPLMVAPPGVHEANLPAIVAGDAGRIAMLFPGSESQNFSDDTRPWNMYVVMSVNALASNPTFTWAVANDASDPVHRGACGPGRCDAADGGSMFDFLDIKLSPVDGRIWGTASDTCIADPDPTRDCVHNPQAQQ